MHHGSSKLPKVALSWVVSKVKVKIFTPPSPLTLLSLKIKERTTINFCLDQPLIGTEAHPISYVLKVKSKPEIPNLQIEFCALEDSLFSRIQTLLILSLRSDGTQSLSPGETKEKAHDG